MTTKLLNICDCKKPTAKDVCVFLADYSAILLGAGATCIRIDKNVSRIARAFSMDAEMTVMPKHIHLTVVDDCSGEILTSIATVPSFTANFDIITLLSRLSWEIADKKLDFRRAVESYQDITKDRGCRKWPVLLLVALANASFCRLFGGDAMAMLIVGIATLVGFYLKNLLLYMKTDIRIAFIICSLISTLIAAGDSLFSLGSTPDIAIATSVLYLVPGIPFLNSFSDMLYRHYLCASARFADAIVLTACLSIGLCIGVWLMNISIF